MGFLEEGFLPELMSVLPGKDFLLGWFLGALCVVGAVVFREWWRQWTDGVEELSKDQQMFPTAFE